MRQFVADASHELRTPLAAVRGYAELYRQGAVSEPDDVASAMRRIEDEAARMGRLVEDLLLLARLDEQRPTAHRAGRPHRAGRRRRPGRPGHRPRPRRHPARAGRPAGADRDRRRRAPAAPGGHQPGGQRRQPHPGRHAGRDRRRTGTAARRLLEVRDHGAGHRPRAGRPRVRAVLPGRPLPPARAGRRHRVWAWPSWRRSSSAHGGRVGVTQTPGGGATFVVELPRRTAASPPGRPARRSPSELPVVGQRRPRGVRSGVPIARSAK